MHFNIFTFCHLQETSYSLRIFSKMQSLNNIKGKNFKWITVLEINALD